MSAFRLFSNIKKNAGWKWTGAQYYDAKWVKKAITRLVLVETLGGIAPPTKQFLHVFAKDGPVQLTATPTFAYTPLADVPFSRSTPLLVKKAWTRMTFDAVRDVRLPPRRRREASRSPPKPKR